LLDLAQERQTVHSGHVYVREDHNQLRLDALGELTQCILARTSEVHHIGSSACFSAELLAKQVCNIGFIVDNEDADGHPISLMCCGLRASRQAHGELGELAQIAINLDGPAMLLSHD